MWEAILTDALDAFYSGSLAFTIGDWSVTIAGEPGAAARFSLAAAIAAAENVFSERAGTIQVGDVAVTVAHLATPGGPRAVPASDKAATLAGSIASAVSLPAPIAPVDLVPIPAHATVNVFGRVATEILAIFVKEGHSGV